MKDLIIVIGLILFANPIADGVMAVLSMVGL